MSVATQPLANPGTRITRTDVSDRHLAMHRRSTEEHPHPPGMRHAFGSTPEIGQQSPVIKQNSRGFAEADLQVLGQKALVVRFSE